jgi:hypothetical protein
MAQPPAYDRAFSFTDYTANHPSDQQPGVRLDAEFEAIEVTTDAIRANLALIQRDDGDLRNGSVGPDQLSTALTLGLRSVSTWASGRAFVTNDAVWFGNSKLYRALTSHTSAPAFATDLAAGKWELVLDFAPYAQAAAAEAVTAEVLAGIDLDVDLGPINTALASKANLAGGNTFTGAQLFQSGVTFSAAVALSALPTTSIAAATTAQDYAAWKPTDYGAGKPGLFARKKATATAWAFEVDDGLGGGGSLDLPATTTRGGAALAAQSDVTALQTAVRRARNLALTAR